MRCLSNVIFLIVFVGMSFQSTSAFSVTQREQQQMAKEAEGTRELAERGQASAQWVLGHLYLSGLGVPKDENLAVAWMSKAAEQGDAKLQADLGNSFLSGAGVPKNYSLALAWLTKAAEQGNISAQSSLGMMYRDGLGVIQDDAEAYKWLIKAAEKEDVGAQWRLGQMYVKGEGVPKDFVQAYMWLNLAAAGGSNSAAAFRDDPVARFLTPSQREEAQRLTREWLSNHPKQQVTPAPLTGVFDDHRLQLQLLQLSKTAGNTSAPAASSQQR